MPDQPTTPHIFSPSAIKVYSECPIKYELMYLDQWYSRQADRPFWGRVAGSAFAEGSAILNSPENFMTAVPECNLQLKIDLAIKAALKSITDDIDPFMKAGGILDRTDLENVKRDVAQALTKYANNSPFADWKEILHVEYGLGTLYGNCRLDVIGRDRHNVLSFADIKFKRYLDTQYVDKTVEEYRWDWQFLHYQWAMEKYFNEPVNAYLCLVRLKSAWQAQLFEFTYNAALIHSVGLSVGRYSEDMGHAIERGTALGTTHDTKFGPCAYKEACLKLQWNEDLMKQNYIQLPPRGK